MTPEASGSPAPSAAEARCFFRGGGDAPPVSESEEEEAEARVSSPRAAVVRSRQSSGWEIKVTFPGLGPLVFFFLLLLLFLSKQLQL